MTERRTKKSPALLIPAVCSRHLWTFWFIPIYLQPSSSGYQIVQSPKHDHKWHDLGQESMKKGNRNPPAEQWDQIIIKRSSSYHLLGSSTQTALTVATGSSRFVVVQLNAMDCVFFCGDLRILAAYYIIQIAHVSRPLKAGHAVCLEMKFLTSYGMTYLPHYYCGHNCNGE